MNTNRFLQLSVTIILLLVTALPVQTNGRASQLYADGDFLWARRMGGTDIDRGLSIAVDTSGNVYTTGFFAGTVDFDPGADTYYLRSVGSDDIFISKLDSSGNLVWAKRMGGADPDAGYSIAVDASGNVYITGEFEGTTDFDPGAGTYNLTSAEYYDIFIAVYGSQGAQLLITIGDTLMGRYVMAPGNVLVKSYAGVQNGPVKVSSPIGYKLFASERVISGDSFNEVMGFPTNQLTTEYWFPWYDNASMATWVLVVNPTSSTANMEIYVCGAKSTYTIPANGRITLRYGGTVCGPVRVLSTNGVKVFSSERVLYGTSFNEVMGYPGNKLTTEYWFPWYDSTSMSTDVLVGRP